MTLTSDSKEWQCQGEVGEESPTVKHSQEPVQRLTRPQLKPWILQPLTHLTASVVVTFKTTSEGPEDEMTSGENWLATVYGGDHLPVSQVFSVLDAPGNHRSCSENLLPEHVLMWCYSPASP